MKMPPDYWSRIGPACEVFTPGYPVSKKDAFAGRTTELDRALEAVLAPGRHPIIYGQRGVGKTSLANVLEAIYGSQGIATKASCGGGDTFRSVWDRLLRDAPVEFKRTAFGFSNQQIAQRRTLADFLPGKPDEIGPSDVAQVLGLVKHLSMFILDEYDKISDDQARAYTAELIKTVSDNYRKATIVLVGVGESITQLIGDHPSVQRNLVQIELPTMTVDEIKQIARRGWDLLELQYTDPILDDVAVLANGFPHYAHLLGLCAAKACATQETHEITGDVFSIACDLAIGDAIERYRNAYATATRTSKPSRYPRILCACAYATHDERGVFRATDVVDAMWKVFNEHVSVQAIVPALGAFCNKDRGEVLTAVPVRGRKHYELTDPMMRPFLMIKTSQLLRGV